MLARGPRSLGFGIGCLIIAVACAAAVPKSVSAFGRRAVPVCAPPCPECGPLLAFAAGANLENLQVHVVGHERNTLEIFFNNEFYRDTITGAYELQTDECLALAPENPFGTFAVRYGSARDTFKVYGWKKTATAPVVYGPITPEPGSFVCLHWVTPRILKVTYGPDKSKEHIVRFNDSDNPWTVLLK
jgi:hypothetical protein